MIASRVAAALLFFASFLGKGNCLAPTVWTYTVPEGAPGSKAFSVAVNGKPSGVFLSRMNENAVLMNNAG